jgi:hypothetical protein
MTGPVPTSEDEAMKLWEQYKTCVSECVNDAPHLKDMKKDGLFNIRSKIKVGQLFSILFISIWSLIFCLYVVGNVRHYRSIASLLLLKMNIAIESIGLSQEDKDEAVFNYKNHTFPLKKVLIWFFLLSLLVGGLGYVLVQNQSYIDKTSESFAENHIEYIWNNYPNVINDHPYLPGDTYAELQEIKIESLFN